MVLQLKVSNEAKVDNYFSSPITARYVRMYILTSYRAPSFRAGLSLGTATSNPAYEVAVSGNPGVFNISDTPQLQINFAASEKYIFDQSDSTNAGQQIVFGYTPDDTSNILTAADGVTIMGTPGQPGAYTQLELPADFTGPLYYYNYATPYMGNGPLVLSVDETTRAYGEVVTFTVTNRTGVAETYTITELLLVMKNNYIPMYFRHCFQALMYDYQPHYK